MKKIDFTKLNRSNSDIWGDLKMALKSKNFAVIESSLSRLYSLQKYYIDLLNFQDIEINQLKDLYKQESEIRESFEKEWLESLAVNSKNYEQLKERINATYREIQP
jgi:hypothetical protein